MKKMMKWSKQITLIMFVAVGLMSMQTLAAMVQGNASQPGVPKPAIKKPFKKSSKKASQKNSSKKKSKKGYKVPSSGGARSYLKHGSKNSKVRAQNAIKKAQDQQQKAQAKIAQIQQELPAAQSAATQAEQALADARSSKNISKIRAARKAFRAASKKVESLKRALITTQAIADKAKAAEDAETKKAQLYESKDSSGEQGKTAKLAVDQALKNLNDAMAKKDPQAISAAAQALSDAQKGLNSSSAGTSTLDKNKVIDELATIESALQNAVIEINKKVIDGVAALKSDSLTTKKADLDAWSDLVNLMTQDPAQAAAAAQEKNSLTKALAQFAALPNTIKLMQSKFQLQLTSKEQALKAKLDKEKAEAIALAARLAQTAKTTLANTVSTALGGLKDIATTIKDAAVSKAADVVSSVATNLHSAADAIGKQVSSAMDSAANAGATLENEIAYAKASADAQAAQADMKIAQLKGDAKGLQDAAARLADAQKRIQDAKNNQENIRTRSGRFGTLVDALLKKLMNEAAQLAQPVAPAVPVATVPGAPATVLSAPAGFTKEAENMVWVSVGVRAGKFEAWAVGKDGNLYLYSTGSMSTNPWSMQTSQDASGAALKGFTSVSVTSNGGVYALANGMAYSFDATTKRWTLMNAGAGNEALKLTHISAGNFKNIWATDGKKVYQYDATKGWAVRSDAAKIVSAAIDNTVYALNPDGVAYRLAASNEWVSIPATVKFINIATGSKDLVFAVADDGALYRLTASGWNLENDASGKKSSGLAMIAVNAGGAMIMVASDGSLYRNGNQVITPAQANKMIATKPLAAAKAGQKALGLKKKKAKKAVKGKGITKKARKAAKKKAGKKKGAAKKSSKKKASKKKGAAKKGASKKKAGKKSSKKKSAAKKKGAKKSSKKASKKKGVAKKGASKKKASKKSSKKKSAAKKKGAKKSSKKKASKKKAA